MRRHVVPTLIALTLTLLFGLHLLRSFVVTIAMYLHDAAEVPPPVAALSVLVPLGIAFLASGPVQRAGESHALVVTAAGVTVARLTEQVSGTPAVDLVVGAIGIGLLLWFVPLALMQLSDPSKPEQDDRRWIAIGVVTALALDTMLKGLFATMDVSWRRDRTGYLLVAMLGTANLIALWMASRDRSPRPRPVAFPPAALVGLGPAIAIELLVLQNIGQQTVASGWSQELTFLWISAGNVTAIALVGLLPVRWVGHGVTGIAGAAVALLVWIRPTGTPAAVAQFISALLVAHLLLSVTVARQEHRSDVGRRRVTAIVGPTAAGILAFLVIVLVYYAGYEIRLPFDQRLLVPAAALVLAASAWRAVRAPLGGRVSWRGPSVVAIVGVVLLAIPAYRLSTQDTPDPVQGTGLPMRVMTYNVHHGFDPEGRPSIERIARIIEAEDPDVVALQEVSRAWLVAGSFDMLEWLSRRLDMPYVWGPAADDVWGNAVLSRFPMSGGRTVTMPNNDEIVLDRSFTHVDVDAGNGDTLAVYVTHLHATRRDSSRRVAQLDALIADGAGSTDTIVMGDLNFRAWDPEADVLAAAGLRDAYEAGRRGSDREEDGITTRANVRIDYIWVASSLDTTGFTIGSEFASDHLPIAVTVSR